MIKPKAYILCAASLKSFLLLVPSRQVSQGRGGPSIIHVTDMHPCTGPAKLPPLA
jgi:hypothetical protein